MVEERYSQRFAEVAAAVNEAVLGRLLPPWLWSSLPQFVQTWLRNYLSSLILYFVINTLWCFYIYYWKWNVHVPKDAVPSAEAVMKQISAAMKALPWMAAAMAFSSHLIENGRTKCFSSITEVGPIRYISYLMIYLILLEFCIYWIHRSMHDVRPLYEYVHFVHHKYNKQNTLSPFAGMALHPVDGVLNLLPHIVLPCIIPVHFTTHSALMLVDGLWTTNIHDAVEAKTWPAMGAGHHTIHHITYRHNYGHYTVLMDWLFGTLQDPRDDACEEVEEAKKNE